MISSPGYYDQSQDKRDEQLTELTQLKLLDFQVRSNRFQATNDKPKDAADSARDSCPNSGMQNQRALYSSSNFDTAAIQSKVQSPLNGSSYAEGKNNNSILNSLDLKQAKLDNSFRKDAQCQSKRQYKQSELLLNISARTACKKDATGIYKGRAVSSIEKVKPDSVPGNSVPGTRRSQSKESPSELSLIIEHRKLDGIQTAKIF